MAIWGLTEGKTRARSVTTILATFVLVGGLAVPSGAYVRPGRTELVTRSHDGSQVRPIPLGQCLQHGGDMSANGRYIAFHSEAGNIVPGDTNASCDVFIRDRKRGDVERVSVASNGSQAVGACASAGTGSSYPSISNNGRFVAFESCATNLVNGDTNLTWDVFVHDRQDGTTRRVSLASDGSQAEPLTWSGFPDVGNDGQVVFASAASNLVDDDGNGAIDIFLHTNEGETSRMSVATAGSEGNAASEDPTMTPDGRFVVFRSTADNLVVGDTNRSSDVFVRDVAEASTELISVSSDGTQGDGRSLVRAAYFGPSISANGRFVSFTSQAMNLVPKDSNLIFDDGFVHDRQTGRTERISVTSNGEEGSFSSVAGAISQTGRYVTMSSINSSFSSGPDDNSGTPFGDGDIYLYDRDVGSLTWISVAPDGSEGEKGNGTAAFTATLSTDARGRFVTFLSDASNLVLGDDNDWRDIFVRDLGAELGVGGLGDSAPQADPGPEDEICIAPDMCVRPSGMVTVADGVKDAISDPVLASGEAELIEAKIAFRPQYKDLLTTIELEHMPRVLPGISPIFYGLRFKMGDKSHEVRASSLNGGTFGLFDCTDSRPACPKVAELKGGYGTTGMRVVFSLPLDRIGLDNGESMKDVEAYSALGTYQMGSSMILDRIKIR